MNVNSKENFQNRTARKARMLSVLLAVLLFLTAILTGCGGGSDGPQYHGEEIRQEPSSESDDRIAEGPTESSGTVDLSGEYLQVDFIDVGQGDCILFQCGGETMLVDGGPSDASNVVYHYLAERDIDYLDVVMATHCDADHCGGLSGALEYAQAGTIYCSVTEYDSRAFENFAFHTEEQGLEITVPEAGESFSLGGAVVEILAPIYFYEDDNNNNSIVLKVTYGDVSFLITGDASEEEERDLLESGADLSATVLKVGHHGSRSSTTYQFLREVMPVYGVICVGADNDYGHPTEEVLSRLRDADVVLYRTDLQGDIICVTDGENIQFSVGRGADVQTNPTENGAPEENGAGYVGNSNSRKYHLPGCASVEEMNPENQVFFDSWEEAEAAGYSPCGRCMG